VVAPDRESWFDSTFLSSVGESVLRFNSIVDYIEWVNPVVERGPRAVERGLRVWRDIERVFEEYGVPAASVEGASVQLGGVFSGGEWSVGLYSHMFPRIPLSPRFVALRRDGEWRVVPVRSRRAYISILRQLIRAVVVVE